VPASVYLRYWLLITRNIHCWLCKTPVTIYWLHFRVNLICNKSFLPTKKNNCMLFVMRYNFSGDVKVFNFINDVTVLSA